MSKKKVEAGIECPACGSVERKTDVYASVSGDVDVQICTGCGYVFSETAAPHDPEEEG